MKHRSKSNFNFSGSFTDRYEAHSLCCRLEGISRALAMEVPMNFSFTVKVKEGKAFITEFRKPDNASVALNLMLGRIKKDVIDIARKIILAQGDQYEMTFRHQQTLN